MSESNLDLIDGWNAAGAPKRQSDLARSIESLEPGQSAAFHMPLGESYNAPATQAARSGKRLGRKFVWRRSPDDADLVEVKRLK